MFICPKHHLRYFFDSNALINGEKKETQKEQKNQEKRETQEKYSFSIVDANFFSLNEIEISQRILQIKKMMIFLILF